MIQDPIPFNGNVPVGMSYPEYTNFLRYGCTTTDCTRLPRAQTTVATAGFAGGAIDNSPGDSEY
jgi:hypothetical protein